MKKKQDLFVDDVILLPYTLCESLSLRDAHDPDSPGIFTRQSFSVTNLDEQVWDDDGGDRDLNI